MTAPIDHLYILGAGASISYGLPPAKQLVPQVRSTLADGDRAIFDAALFEAYGVQMSAPAADIDFEDFLNRLDPNGLSYLDDQDLGQPLQDRKNALQIALSGLRSLIQNKCDKAKDAVGPYDRLVSAPSLNSVFVSFNWDILLESAFSRARKEFAYLPTPTAGLRQIILKPHGSINWYALLDRELLMVSIKSNLRAVGDDISYYLLYRPAPFSPIDFRWSSVEYALSKVPAIVPPQSSKLLSVGGIPRDGFVEAGHLRIMKAIWHAFFNYVQKAKMIVIVGYSLPGTDAAAITVLRTALASGSACVRDIVLVEPNDKIQERYEKVLGVKVRLSCNNFEDFDPLNP